MFDLLAKFGTFLACELSLLLLATVLETSEFAGMQFDTSKCFRTSRRPTCRTTSPSGATGYIANRHCSLSTWAALSPDLLES
jgi:hypothetical protein